MFIKNSDDLKLLNSGTERDKNELFKKYHKIIYGNYFKELKDPESAKDLTQEALIKIFNNLHKYNQEYPFNRWVYVVTNNFLKDFYRFNKTINAKIESKLLDSNEPFIQELKFSSKDKIENELNNKNLILHLNKNIKNILNKDEIKVYELVFLKEYTYEEVSKLYNLQKGRISQICKKIKDKIKIFLTKEEYIVD